jgi:3-dehydroquinate synthase
MMSSPHETVRVELGPRSYPIAIAADSLPRLGEFIAEQGQLSHAVIMTDENVHKPHALRAAESLSARSVEVAIMVLQPGEASKSVEVAATLWQGMLDLGADRQTVVVAVGGGVVGDLAGFIAATYARGIRFVQVPTTLLAQVDSSVGGKVGINLPGAKNMVGAFLQPLGVLVDTATLATLPDREFRSGLGEVVKYGVALDAGLFEYLEDRAGLLLARDPETLIQTIARCCRLKAEVVRQDEREQSGLRAVLNYGHTFAHAFETLTGYSKLLHGEAVALGMVAAARLAERLGRVERGFADRQRALLEALGLPVRRPKLDPRKILSAMAHDKKVAGGRLRFVLPSRLGHAELVENVPEADVRAALREG